MSQGEHMSSYRRLRGAAVVAAAASALAMVPSAHAADKWATTQSAKAGGGMAALIAAAKKEGTLNVIALPPDWANYGELISTFKSKYGIKVNSANPDGSSAQEIQALKQLGSSSRAPDVVDVGQAFALPSVSLFAPYKVATWNTIPAGN